jgi:type I site-specific restriction endonuclease
VIELVGAPAPWAAQNQTTTSGPPIILSPIELRPEPFQERLLEQIALARERGRRRNLLVSATGTGKTVMVAIPNYPFAHQLLG